MEQKKKKNKMSRKDKSINIRVHSTQHDIIKERANKTQRTIADFMRWCAVEMYEDYVSGVKEQREYIKQCKKIIEYIQEAE